ncbi:MAG TPA: hypothetical protein VLI05_00135 [Candidatus Saccharimonadia bacterium]|nr:hypothetical protein [Candidatus Saccharimonadia bacterium]
MIDVDSTPDATTPVAPRDEAWLQQLLDETWDSYFADVPQENDVRIVFGRRAKRRLGSIALDPRDQRTSVITMNGLFRLAVIPDFVVQATLVHELTHYAHGFNSPLNQRQQHPHAGGVMRREFDERDLLQLYLQQKKWLKQHWPAIIAQEFQTGRSTRASRTATIKIPKPFWFLGE